MDVMVNVPTNSTNFSFCRGCRFLSLLSSRSWKLHLFLSLSRATHGTTRQQLNSKQRQVEAKGGRDGKSRRVAGLEEEREEEGGGLEKDEEDVGRVHACIPACERVGGGSGKVVQELVVFRQIEIRDDEGWFR